MSSTKGPGRRGHGCTPHVPSTTSSRKPRSTEPAAASASRSNARTSAAGEGSASGYTTAARGSPINARPPSGDNAMLWIARPVPIRSSGTPVSVSQMNANPLVRKTMRRVNALEKIAIPDYEESIKYIEDTLEESERETFATLKLVKERLEKHKESFDAGWTREENSPVR